MKQTIVAIYKTSSIKDNQTVLNESSNDRWIELCKQYGELLTLKEFEERYNNDEINFESTIIRFIEVELEVKACN